jgi:hypothetical protein
VAKPEYKKSFKIMTTAIIIVLVIIVGVLIYKVDVYFRNTARQQSVFIENYAKSQHMILFDTNGDNGRFFPNKSPWYEMYYKSRMSTTAIKNSLLVLLNSNGYKVNYVLYNPDPCWPLGPLGGLSVGATSCPPPALYWFAYNGDKPYWVFNATKGKLGVGAYITNISYDDPKITNNTYQKISSEHPVPQGYNVLDITMGDN